MDARKRNIVIAVMVAMFLGAVEGTIVTTAVPTIVRELKGFELISWVFSLYLLTSAVTTPIYGKLSDLYGRKNVLSIGIVIFLIGSSLCGLSQNMYQLIAFRALQGLGAGSIFTVTFTIVGDVFSLSERAKVQGWLSAVWGIASLVGPFLGGFLIDYLSWHWIFFVNIPFGILSIILLQSSLHENFERKKSKIDYAGTIVLSCAMVIFLYGILSGGEGGSLFSPFTIAVLVCTIALLVLFYFIEKRAEEPIMPFEIFTKTNIIANIISFLAAAVLIGADVYMPIYIQSVLGMGATVSGLTMAPMSVSWLLSSVILGKAIPKYGERSVTLVSASILLASCAFLPTLGVNSPLILVAVYAFAMGWGFGGCFTTLTIIVQESVNYSMRGAATASNALIRTLSPTIAVSIFGSILNSNIVKYFNNIGIKGVEPNNLYSGADSANGLSVDQIKASLDCGLHVVFVLMVVLVALCVVTSFTLPNRLKKEKA